MLTVDLFSIYLLSRADNVIRYIEVDFTDYVRYIEEFVISRFVIRGSIPFYCNFGRGVEYRSFYRGLR